MSEMSEWERLGRFMMDRLVTDTRNYQPCIRLLDSDKMRPPACRVEKLITFEWSYDKKYAELSLVYGEVKEFYFRDSEKKRTVTLEDLDPRDHIRSIREFIAVEFPALQDQLQLDLELARK